MAVCKFFKRGYCRFGNKCRREHVTAETYIFGGEQQYRQLNDEWETDEEEQDPGMDRDEEEQDEEQVNDGEEAEDEEQVDEEEGAEDETTVGDPSESVDEVQEQLHLPRCSSPKLAVQASTSTHTPPCLSPHPPPISTSCDSRTVDPRLSRLSSPTDPKAPPATNRSQIITLGAVADVHKMVTDGFQHQLNKHQHEISIYHKDIMSQLEKAEKACREWQERVIHVEKVRGEERGRYEAERKEKLRKIEWEKEERHKMLQAIEIERKRRKDAIAKQVKESEIWKKEKAIMVDRLKAERRAREAAEERIKGCVCQGDEEEQVLQPSRKKRKEMVSEEEEDPDSWMDE